MGRGELNPVEQQRRRDKQRANKKIRDQRVQHRHDALYNKPIHELQGLLYRERSQLSEAQPNVTQKNKISRLEQLIEQKQNDLTNNLTTNNTTDNIIVTGALGNIIKHNQLQDTIVSGGNNNPNTGSKKTDYELITLLPVPPGLCNIPTSADIPIQFRSITNNLPLRSRPPPPPPSRDNIYNLTYAAQQSNNLHSHQHQQSTHNQQQSHNQRHSNKKYHKHIDRNDPLNPDNLNDSEHNTIPVIQYNRDSVPSINHTIPQSTDSTPPGELPVPPVIKSNNNTVLKQASSDVMKSAVLMPSNIRVKRVHADTNITDHMPSTSKRLFNSAPNTQL